MTNQEFRDDEQLLVEEIAESAIDSLMQQFSLDPTTLQFTDWINSFSNLSTNTEVREHVREEVSYFVETGNITNMIERIVTVYGHEKVNIGTITRYQLKYQNERLYSQVYKKVLEKLVQEEANE